MACAPAHVGRRTTHGAGDRVAAWKVPPLPLFPHEPGRPSAPMSVRARGDNVHVSGATLGLLSPAPARHSIGRARKRDRHARCTTDSGRGDGVAVVPLHVGSSTTLSSGAALRRRNSVSPQLRPPEETVGLLPEASLPCLSRRPHLLYDYVYGRMPGPLYVRQSNRGAGASRWTRMRSDTAFHPCRAPGALVAYTHAALPCTVVPTKSLSDVCGSPRLTHLPARLARRDYGSGRPCGPRACVSHGPPPFPLSSHRKEQTTTR